ncbi:MAG: energy transducer TonB [Flavobacteriia bacterium]|nr:energy transducer TonB [Flavobacteriia bacterium]
MTEQSDFTIHKIVDEEARFPEGDAALKQFIVTNLQYPENAKELGIEGKCYLTFVVSETGQCSDFKVVRGVPDCPECDKEAVRILKLMPDWKPGRINGKNVRSYYNLPVKFSLN